MFLPSFTILFFAMILLININAMPSLSADQIDDGQINNSLYENEVQQLFQRSSEFPSWTYKRNSPLCDYRLQFRPLPLTSALCGYGLLKF
jgi:hypothetical protein